MGRKKRMFFLSALAKRNEEVVAEVPAPPQEEPVVVEQPVVEEIVVEKPVAKTVKAAKPK
jgi:hypothetical protein